MNMSAWSTGHRARVTESVADLNEQKHQGVIRNKWILFSKTDAQTDNIDCVSTLKRNVNQGDLQFWKESSRVRGLKWYIFKDLYTSDNIILNCQREIDTYRYFCL